MRGFYMDEPFTGSPSDLEHISHDANFTAKQWVDNTSASLAPIEATSTASQPYTVGKRLVYGGRLYKVTQAIAQGGTLTPDTNITLDTVDEELNTINTHLTVSSTTQNLNTGLTGTCTIYKVGGVKQLSIYFTCTAGTLSTLSGNIVTLLSNNRPRTNMASVASDQNGTLMYVSVNASNGTVRTFGSNLANVTSMTISSLYM